MKKLIKIVLVSLVVILVIVTVSACVYLEFLSNALYDPSEDEYSTIPKVQQITQPVDKAEQ